MFRNNPYQVVRDFESALGDYTGAPYVVTTTSCTMALLLAVAWHLRQIVRISEGRRGPERMRIEIPKRTYIGVPMSVINGGGWPEFIDTDWEGRYRLNPLPIWDSARWLSGGLYRDTCVINDNAVETMAGEMVCLSFHPTKHLGISTHGGAILHDNPEADAWLRRARFDGRSEGVNASDDRPDHIGFHCYMTPPTAAEGLQRLYTLPVYNEPLPNDNYPDLSDLSIFK
jgi:dTDP-4-amino-4,6-dideoxygalactose transaminase